jgi:hypothetical protein
MLLVMSLVVRRRALGVIGGLPWKKNAIKHSLKR